MQKSGQMTMIPLLAGKAVLIPAAVHAEKRGTLRALECGPLGFAAVRVFTVTAPDGAVRGGHAHKAGRQILMWVAGTIGVELRHGGEVERLTLAEDSPALLIDSGVWSSQTYGGGGGTMLVLCDTPFDPNDYHDDER
jgi:hypothetical protein